ncbi:MAG: DUF58 domain-containing protein [Planctomycetaceae bacterium]
MPTDSATADLRRLLPSPAELARLQGLQLRARCIVEGHLTGLHRSPRRGFSVEFAEHREYTPGDDLRYLDWKVWGKRDRLYLKQFEEETNFACHLLVDASESMNYRSADTAMSKWQYAATLATSLAWLILRQQDAVGLTTFNTGPADVLKPSGSAAQLKQIATLLEATKPVGESKLGDVLGTVAEHLPRRGLVLLIGDLFDDLDSVRQGLKRLAFRGHDIGVLQVIDPAEVDFPFVDPVQFDGLEGTGSESIDPNSLRAAYRSEFNRFLNEARGLCRELSVHHQLVRTDQSPTDVLLKLLTSARPA